MRRVVSLVAIGSLAAAAFAWQQSVDQLQQDGKTISTRLRLVDGVLMVPVKDVASYLGGDLTVQNGTATIGATRRNDPIGGSAYGSQSGALGSGASVLGAGMNPLNSQANTLQPLLAPSTLRPDPKDIHVNIGQDANNGGFVLRVLGMEEINKGNYKTQFDPRKRSVSPSLRDDRIVVVRMRLENRTATTQHPPVPSGLDIALFDAGGVGVPVLAFDARPIGNSNDYDTEFGQYDALDAPILEPKGSFEFAVVFSLPKASIPTKVTVALPSSSEDNGGANVTIALR